MDYISYSQYSTYTSCPRSWYLSKRRSGEERQTWYLPVGTAVHQMIEDYLDPDIGGTLVTPEKAETYFYPLVQRQLEVEPDTSKWLAAGSKDAPVVEDRALRLVRDSFTAAVEELDSIDVWEVEFDASGRLPGLAVPVRAYVDIVGEKKGKGPVIIDWKTGTTKPGNFQLETYAALGIQLAPLKDVSKLYGRYVMLKPGAPRTRYVDLSKVDPAEVGAKYQKVYEAMERTEYQAQQGFGCRFCLQQDNCLANAGMTRRALYYDKSEDDGIPY